MFDDLKVPTISIVENMVINFIFIINIYIYYIKKIFIIYNLTFKNKVRINM